MQAPTLKFAHSTHPTMCPLQKRSSTWKPAQTGRWVFSLLLTRNAIWNPFWLFHYDIYLAYHGRHLKVVEMEKYSWSMQQPKQHGHLKLPVRPFCHNLCASHEYWTQDVMQRNVWKVMCFHLRWEQSCPLVRKTGSLRQQWPGAMTQGPKLRRCRWDEI